jgi:hypothetical protein
MQMLFWRKFFEGEHCPITGPLQPCTYTFTTIRSSYVKQIEKYLAFEPRPDWELNASSNHRVSSIRRDAKIEKFDTKMKLMKQKNMPPKG